MTTSAEPPPPPPSEVYAVTGLDGGLLVLVVSPTGETLVWVASDIPAARYATILRALADQMDPP